MHEWPTKESGPWRLNTFPAHLFPLLGALPFPNNLFVFLFINICRPFPPPQTQLLGSALLSLLTQTFLPLSSLPTTLGKGLTFCLPLPPSLSSGHLLRSPLGYPWGLSLKLTIAYELLSKYFLILLLVKINNQKEASVFLVTVIVPYLVRRADNAVFLSPPQSCYMDRVEPQPAL